MPIVAAVLLVVIVIVVLLGITGNLPGLPNMPAMVNTLLWVCVILLIAFLVQRFALHG